MIDRDMWERCVKEVRTYILNKTHDPDFRRITAGIMDAVCDSLYETLNARMTIREEVTITADQFEQVSQNSLKTARELIPDAPDWLENILHAFSSQLKCDLFYPDKEV